MSSHSSSSASWMVRLPLLYPKGPEVTSENARHTEGNTTSSSCKAEPNNNQIFNDIAEGGKRVPPKYSKLERNTNRQCKAVHTPLGHHKLQIYVINTPLLETQIRMVITIQRFNQIARTLQIKNIKLRTALMNLDFRIFLCNGIENMALKSKKFPNLSSCYTFLLR